MKAVEEQTGIANNTIAKLESGNMQATPKYLEALAPVYGCAPRDFLPPDESMPSVAEAALLDAIRGDDADAIREAMQAAIPAATLAQVLGGRRLPSLAKQELIDAIDQATAGLSRIAAFAKSNALDSEAEEQK